MSRSLGPRVTYYEGDGDDDDDDDIKVYGTPLPGLDEDEIAPKKASLDLTVRDEQGRRRFHGAFTGGFSAGYFNTVGSKEGWVPSQFTSSRKSKWSKDLIQDRPEDFMDEEDFNAHGIAPKRVHTTDKFTSSTSSRELESFAGFRDSSACDLVDFLRETVAPAKVSVGVKLLKYLKGTSKRLQEEKLNASEKKTKNKEQISDEPEAKKAKVYGCLLPPGMSFSFDLSDDDESSDDEQLAAEGINESEQVIHPYKLPYEVKKNRHGLGYSGMLDGSDFFSSTQSACSLSLTGSISGRKLKISGDAFGTGVLEEENDGDDVNLYETDDLSKYDFELRAGRGDGKKEERKKRRLASVAATSSSSHDQGKLDELFQLFSSSDEKFNYSNKYKVPELPRNWKPRGPFTPLSSVSTSLVTSSTAASDNNSHKRVQEEHMRSDERNRRRRDLYSLPHHHEESDDDAAAAARSRSGSRRQREEEEEEDEKEKKNVVKAKTTGSSERKSRWDQQESLVSVTKNNVPSAPGQSEQKDEQQQRQQHEKDRLQVEGEEEKRKSQVGSVQDDDGHHHHRHDHPRESTDDRLLDCRSIKKSNEHEKRKMHMQPEVSNTSAKRSSFTLHDKMSSTNVSTSACASASSCSFSSSSTSPCVPESSGAVSHTTSDLLKEKCSSNLSNNKRQVRPVMDARVRSVILGDGLNVGVTSQSVKKTRVDEHSKSEDNDTRNDVDVASASGDTHATLSNRVTVQLQQQPGHPHHEELVTEMLQKQRKQQEEEDEEKKCTRNSTNASALADASTSSSSSGAAVSLLPRKTTLSGFFASKFVHSSSASSTSVIESSDVNLQPGLTMSTDLTVKLDKSKNRPDDLNSQAEQEISSLIGKKTRICNEWMPHKVLCKRFNVPYPDSRPRHH